MVPGIDDAAAHMFPLGGRLVGAGGLLDVDREFLFGSMIGRSASALDHEGKWRASRLQDAGRAHLVWS